MIWLFLLPLAHALGESADIELLHPSLAPEGMPGVDTAAVEGFGHLRMVLFSQYVRDPLVLYAEDEDRGAVVAQRLTSTLGIRLDLSRRTVAQLSLPVMGQWGSEHPEDTGSVFGTGDPRLGLRLRLVQQNRWSIGASGDVYVPVGTQLSWMAEQSPRLQVGVLASWESTVVDVMANTHVRTRQPVVTDRDFTLGSDWSTSLGSRLWIWPERLNLGAVLLSRTALNAPFAPGAETATELLSVVQFHPNATIQWDFGVGKGLAQGAGTSEFRAFTGITKTRRPPPPAPIPPPVIQITEIPEPIDVEIITETAWEPEELARVEEQRIIIRDPIQFEYNTANILPQSIPTLHYVAELMNEDWRIGHVVIEGHASEEGSYEYNYELSALRARSIWEELQRAAVHPDRVSYRGMGEVLPVSTGEDEASLASNRRVEFHVVRQIADDAQDVEYRPVEQRPWNGDSADLQTPQPEPAPQPEEDTIDLEQFQDTEDEGLIESNVPQDAPSPGQRP